MHYAWLCFHGRSHIGRTIIIINVHASKSYSTDHKQLNIYSRMLAKSMRVRVEYLRAHVHCPWVEVLHSLIHMNELQVPRANIASGSTIHVHTDLACARTAIHTPVHALVRYSHSCSTHERCIDISQALTLPLRVKRAWALNCLWSVLYMCTYVGHTLK